MRDFFEILTNEEKSFEFPWWVYAIVMPMAFVGMLGIVGWLESFK